MNSKILLLSIAVISVGLFAMPSTLSLFSGQHTFTNGSSVACTKCHADVYSEISGTTGTAHTNPQLKACEGCHRTGALVNIVPKGDNTNISYNNTNIDNSPTAHAAVTLECVACHQAVPQNITGTDEAHRKFYWNSSYTANASANLAIANQTNIALKGANTACIGCHTHAVVNITWKRAAGYNIEANASTGTWTMIFSTNTSQMSTKYSAGE